MRPLRVPRYRAGAAVYDLVSFERPVYRVGRLRAIEQLRLAAGDLVLDIGCGTGLNFAPLRERIGSSGHIVGVDASESMLAQARRKIGPAGGVTLVHADAGRLDELVADLTFDAVVCTYALSIIPGWRAAWAAARAASRVGGRLAVADLALPTRAGRLLEPVARFACFTGGVDLGRQPWNLVEDELDDVVTERHRSGHVVVSAGTNPTANTAATTTTTGGH